MPAAGAIESDGRDPGVSGERQLAHGERDKVRAAYNKALYMDKRTEIMQAWADYLDSKKADPAKVVPIQQQKVEIA